MADGAMADDIAGLLTATPQDIYAAVVSSSFDADRLDYLQRDKLMTGSGAGGIDFDWLKDNLRVAKVRGESEGSGDGAPLEVETFCFTEKASQAAERVDDRVDLGRNTAGQLTAGQQDKIGHQFV